MEPARLPDVPASDEGGLRPVDVHRDYLLSHVTSLRPFGIGLLDAAGLTLCESLTSDIDLPVFTSATVAGWAVRGSNLVGASAARPVTLPVVDEIEAGGFRGAPLMPGTVVKVAAGAPVPESADAVVALADGVQSGDEVAFTTEAVFHQNLLAAGSRIADGSLLVESGTVLDARTIGLLAEVGIDKVLARPRPRVVIASLGANLVDPGLPLENIHQSYDSATSLFAATARADGAQVFPIGIVPGEVAQLRRTLSEQLLRADLVLIAADVTPELVGVLGGLGAVDEAGLAIEPEVPGLFAVIGDEQVPTLVLPRDIVTAYIGYQVFARPLIRKLGGQAPADRKQITAPVLAALAVDPARTAFRLAQSTERGVLPSAVVHPSAVELLASDSLIVIGPGVDGVTAHSDVTCWSLKD